ncbi:hypothetical protein L1987_53531 [Smallanthus sonchifolius]|uniref:Uncharacterized protein n=1 Tax=Smallanthus sonchifolius TaxID=185202 RepID=A0ACB9EWI7_9ASTR|nr:hypothetical protein L1987_53531 [Smallanthus sonchifolius]
MPIFYCVDPSEVRKQKGNFGEGFAKHVTKNINMVESWREALISASEIAGWEPKNIANGHEMKAIKEIVDTISDKLLSLTSNFDEDLVGMRVRMQELEARLEIGSGGDNPNNPEKHSRVWEYENIMYLASATMENDKIEAIRVDYNPQGGGDSSLLCKMISNMKKLRWLSVSPNYRDHAEGPNFLSNELRMFPTMVQMGKLKTLKIEQCHENLEFPDIKSNMESLITLLWNSTFYMGQAIDLVPTAHCELTKGNAIENHNMVLQLQGLEIAKRFKPPLLRGSSCRLQLPENWCNDFSGFLMCAVLSDRTCFTSLNMKQVMSGMKSEDDVVWDESYSNKFRTYVWYVSFASLRHTTWWDETYNAVLFSIDVKGMFRRADTSGFGVRLVARKSGSGPTQTTTAQDSDFSRYTPKLDTYHDSAHLSIFLKKYLMLD